MSSDAQLVLDELDLAQRVDEAAEEPEDIHMPPSSIAPLIVGVGAALLLLGMIAPPLGVAGLVVALVGALRMARFPEIDLHSVWLPQINNRKLGMWAFLTSEILFFTSLIGAFVMFKLDHTAEFREVHEILSLPLATVLA